jgi:hypothetical protein
VRGAGLGDSSATNRGSSRYTNTINYPDTKKKPTLLRRARQEISNTLLTFLAKIKKLDIIIKGLHFYDCRDFSMI